MYRSITRRSVLNSAAIGGAALLLDAGCSRKAAPTNSAKPMDKLTFLTGYGTTAREGYGFVAKGAGFFTAQGIDATIAAGAPSDANLKTLAASKAQFAAIDFVSAVRGAKTYPHIRVVAAVQHQTLLSMITLPSHHIADPRDFVGKTLGTAAAAATQTLFPTYARLAGFDPTKVKFLNFAPDQLPAVMVSGQIDALGGYAIDTPGIENTAHGVDPVVFEYNKYITDLYGTVIICTTDLIKNNPNLVQRFTNGMVTGINFAVNNPGEAGRLMHQAVPTADAGIMETTMGLMKPYVNSAQLDPARVMRGIALLEQAGLADSGLTPDEVVDFSFAPRDV